MSTVFDATKMTLEQKSITTNVDGTLKTDVTLSASNAVANVPGPQGAPGVKIVQHGTNANFARPAGYPVVYWQGTVRPVNALSTDWWYNG